MTYLEILVEVLALEDQNAAMAHRKDNLRRTIWSTVGRHLSPCVVDMQAGSHQSLDLSKMSPVVGSFDDLAEVGIPEDMLLQSDANFCLAPQ